MTQSSNPSPQESNAPATGLSSWGQLTQETWIKAGIIALLLGLVFWSVIYGLIWQWSNDSSWSHGFIIPLFSLYLVHQRKKEIINMVPDASAINSLVKKCGLALLIIALLLFPVNVVHFKIGYAKPILMLVSIFAVVMYLGGRQLVKYSWLPIAYLIFAIPLPDRYYKAITMPLRLFAADISTSILNLVPHMVATANGVVIDIVYKGTPLVPALDVAEACSGMRLLMAFVALGVAMAYLHYRPIWQRLILLLSTVPIAIVCNIIRVTITAFIYVLWEPKYAQGGYHDLLGFAMLFVAFGLYYFIAWFMESLFVEETEVQPDVVVRKKSA